MTTFRRHWPDIVRINCACQRCWWRDLVSIGLEGSPPALCLMIFRELKLWGGKLRPSITADACFWRLLFVNAPNKQQSIADVLDKIQQRGGFRMEQSVSDVKWEQA